MNISDYPVKILGDYVFTPCENQFEGSSKVSYWVSKKGYTFAVYAFSVNNVHAAESMLIDEYLNGYISLFESLSKRIAVMNVYTSIYNESVDDMALNIAKHIINAFIKHEYGHKPDTGDKDYADFSDLTNVEIAYTETEDGFLPIQSSVNLIDFCIVTKVNNEVVRTEQYDSLLDLIEYGLRNLDFSDLVYVEEEKLIPIYRDYLVGQSVVVDNEVWMIKDISDEEMVTLYKVLPFGQEENDVTKTEPLRKVAFLYNMQDYKRMIPEFKDLLKYLSLIADIEEG